MTKWRFWRPLVILLGICLALLAAGVGFAGWVTGPNGSEAAANALFEAAWVIAPIQAVLPLCRFLLLGYLYLLAYKALRTYLLEHKPSPAEQPSSLDDSPTQE